MLKKIICLGIMAVMCIGGFSGCGATHCIPNGEYTPASIELDYFKLRQEGNNTDHYWKIKGNSANYYESGAQKYKCKIVLEEDNVFFVGSKWTDVFSSLEQGKDFKYEVTYNEEMKSITILK